jgi:hypothetical protein
MKALRKLYTANHDNRVICFGTTLKTFVEAFSEVEPNIGSYFNFRRAFGDKTEMNFKGESGKEYLIQYVYKSDQSSTVE